MGFFLIHYHEIALKKGNRWFFVGKLTGNIRVALKDVGNVMVEKLSGCLLLSNYGSLTSIVKERLGKIPGIANFKEAFESKASIKDLKEKLSKEIRKHKFKSFRITAQRGDKSFPLTSEQISCEIGAFVCEKTKAQVDLTNPELTIFIEVLPGRVFFSFEKIQGVGGLPVGSSGKAVSLLSGGIDSPVASFMLLKRGCELVFVHFHSYPYFDRASQEKVVELVKLLNQYQYNSKLYLLPFGDVQKQIVLKVPELYRVIIYRRLMLSIAKKIAEKEGAKALVTGESLGQVASQTMENISVIEKSVSLPIFRPLIGMDKQEIIEMAKKINTYDISIMPDQDCCQLFTPKHPATKAEIKDVERIEKGLNFEKLISSVVEKAETRVF